MQKQPEPIVVPTATKTCRECGRTGPVDEMFNRNVKSKDGYLHICKDCFSKKHQKSSEETNVRAADGYRTLVMPVPEDLYRRLALVSSVKMRSMGNQLPYCFVQAYPEDDE